MSVVHSLYTTAPSLIPPYPGRRLEHVGCSDVGCRLEHIRYRDPRHGAAGLVVLPSPSARLVVLPSPSAVRQQQLGCLGSARSASDGAKRRGAGSFRSAADILASGGLW